MRGRTWSARDSAKASQAARSEVPGRRAPRSTSMAAVIVAVASRTSWRLPGSPVRRSGSPTRRWTRGRSSIAGTAGAASPGSREAGSPGLPLGDRDYGDAGGGCESCGTSAGRPRPPRLLGPSLPGAFAPARPETRTVLETSSQTSSAGATGQAAAVCWGSGVHEAPAEHVPEGREVDALLSRVLPGLSGTGPVARSDGLSGTAPVRRSGRFTLVEELGLSSRARSQVGAGEPHG